MLLCIETSILFHRALLSISFYAFIFFATHFSYNVYYVKTQQAKLFRILSSISFLLMSLFFFQLKLYNDPHILALSFLSLMYILPIFLPFEKAKSFTVQKLLLLILVWVFCTFFMPLRKIEIEFNTLLLLIFRISILSYSCLLFFIRDEKNQNLILKARQATIPLIALLILLSVVVIWAIDIRIGYIYLLISFLCILLNQYFLSKKREPIQYLKYADGILALQSVLILFFAKH